MPTIIEALTQAGQDLRDAVASARGLYNDMVALKNSTTAQATTIINNFINRPAQFSIFVDPIAGNDANDGTSVGQAKKNLDNVVGGLLTNAAQIFLLNDAQMQRREYTFAPVAIFGIQAANNANGYIFFRRTISFLGTATNSPDSSGNTFSAGIFANGPTLRTQFIDFALPDSPSNLTYRSHIFSFNAPNIIIDTATVIVGSANAGSLFGTSGRITVTATFNLGSGAAGHVFEGVAAGANPNAQWRYATNLTSA